MYLVDSEGQIASPFAWTLIREWLALSLLSSSSPVVLEGDTVWRAVADFPELCQLPTSLTIAKGRDSTGFLLSDARLKLPSLPCQHSYAKTLGSPFNPLHIDRLLLAHIIRSLSYQFPDRVNPTVAKEVEDASDWQNDPASDLQISYLQSIGVPIEDGMTKGRASQLMDGEPTEGQLRRLKFYRITPSTYLTKKEASELIDSYKTEQPESEEHYQAWKLRGCQV